MKKRKAGYILLTLLLLAAIITFVVLLQELVGSLFFKDTYNYLIKFLNPSQRQIDGKTIFIYVALGALLVWEVVWLISNIKNRKTISAYFGQVLLPIVCLMPLLMYHYRDCLDKKLSSEPVVVYVLYKALAVAVVLMIVYFLCTLTKNKIQYEYLGYDDQDEIDANYENGQVLIAQELGKGETINEEDKLEVSLESHGKSEVDEEPQEKQEEKIEELELELEELHANTKKEVVEEKVEEKIETPIVEKEAESKDIEDENKVVDANENEEDDEDEEDEDDEEDENENHPQMKQKIVSRSFKEKMLDLPSETQEYYNEIKNELMSYRKVNARLSHSCDSFRLHRDLLVKLTIAGKTLKMYFNLSNYKIEEKYFVKDVYDKKKYELVPHLLKVKSQRSAKYALEIIQKIMDERGTTKVRKYKNIDFIQELKNSNI